MVRRPGLVLEVECAKGEKRGRRLQDDVNGSRPRRFDGIDVLRGLSIVAVVLHHTNLHMLFEDVSIEKWLPGWLDKDLFWNGANGVTVFFAISGFLIATTAMRRWGSLARVPVLEFYRFRFARIAPLLLTLLVVLSALHLGHVHGFTIKPKTASLPRALLAAVTFHVNWLESVRGYLPSSWDVLWSLSVEEMFYLFFPLVCRLTRGRGVLVVLLLAFVAAGPLARTLLTKNALWRDYGYLACMDGIALGCLAAIASSRLQLWGESSLVHKLWPSLRVVGVLLMAIVLVARPLAKWLHLYRTGLDVTVLALGTCLMMLAIAQKNREGTWASAPLRWFGRNSYEVYLTHMLLVTWGVQWFVACHLGAGLAPLLYLGLLGLSGVLGALVARWYSEPLNRRLRRRAKLRHAEVIA